MEEPQSLEAFVHPGGIRGQIQLNASSTARRRTLFGLLVFVAWVSLAGLTEDLTVMTVLYAASFLTLVGTAFAAVGLINHPVPFDLTQVAFVLDEEPFPYETISSVTLECTAEPPPGVLMVRLACAGNTHEWSVSPYSHTPEDLQWLIDQILARVQ